MTAENFTPRFPFRVRATTTEITKHKLVVYAEDEKEALFRGTATRVYRL